MTSEKPTYGVTTTDTRRGEFLLGETTGVSAAHVKNLDDRSVTSTHVSDVPSTMIEKTYAIPSERLYMTMAGNPSAK